MDFLVPLLSAFTIGLFGSVHCLGMCGGIATALGFSATAKSKIGHLGLIVGYSAGRLATYTLMGALLGWLIHIGPHALHQGHLHHGISIARIVAGMLLIAMGLYLAGWWFGLLWLEKGGTIIWRYIQPLGRRLMPVDNGLKAIGLGIIWGWLPCGLVYSALAYSSTQESMLLAAGTMLAFGLGTSPALIASGVFAQQLRQWVQQRGLRQVLGMLVIIFGVWTIAGGLGLHIM